MPFDRVSKAIDDIRNGRMVIVADDEDRENEGDLVCAAGAVTPDLINFMTKHGRGLICVALTGERADQLDLGPMTETNTDPQGTAFTVSVDAHQRFGVTTGISAFDRSKTVQVLVDAATVPADLRRPGHIFPLRAQPGGVLRRVGQTEASVDLARLAGFDPAGVICEILNEDGTMARRAQLEELAQEHDLSFITVADLVRYRLAKERIVTRVAEAHLPTPQGDFRVIAYRSIVDAREHVALVKGEVENESDVLVRMHSECLTGDVFGSLRCDCGEQLIAAMSRIEEEGRGCDRLPQAGRSRDRAGQQGEGVRTAGRRTGHGRGQSNSRIQARSPRLRDRCPNPARPGAHHDSAADKQPSQDRWAGRLRPGNHGSRAYSDRTRLAQ